MAAIASSSPLLPTPTSAPWSQGGTGAEQTAMKRGLGLLPTPATRDHHAQGAGHNPKARSSSLATTLEKKNALLPTPRVTTNRTGRDAMLGTNHDGHWSAPGLEQAVELAAGMLPHELQSEDELPGRAKKLLPTPVGQDAKNSTAPPSQSDRKSPGLANVLLPTPNAADAERGPDYARHRGDRPESGGDDLVTAMHLLEGGPLLLPTPSAEESEPTDEYIEECLAAGIDPEARLYLPGRKWHAQRTLSRIVPTLLPTPEASDGSRGPLRNPETLETGKRPSGTKAGKTLTTEVDRLLPTPTGSDALGSRRATARTDEWTSNEGTTLTDAALTSAGADTSPPSDAGKSSSGGLRLSPSFVEWMMGAPDGWTDPECELTAHDFLRSGTASSCRPDGSAA